MTEHVRPPLAGEVIPPRAMLAVRARMHPLRPDPQTVLVPVGASVAEIIAACALACRVEQGMEGVHVELNGLPVPYGWFHQVRVKKGTNVVVTAGAGDFIITPLATALASGIGLGTSALAVGVIKFGLTLGLGLVAQLVSTSLFPPSTTKSQTAKEVFSISGSRNEIAPGEPIPTIWGTMRFAGRLGAQPYTEFDGDDQFLTMLIIWGFGPLAISKLKIGDTDIDAFEGVEYQTFEGYMVDGKPDHYSQTIYTRQTFQEDLNIATSKKDGPHVRTTPPDIVSFAVDLVAGGGLYEASDGEIDSQTEVFNIEYRDTGTSGAWLPSRMNYEMTGDSQDPIRRTINQRVPKGQYDVRVTRLSSDEDEGAVVDVTWTALRSRRNAPPINFDVPLAITAIRIKATGQLNGTPDDINALVSARGRRWNGSAWEGDKTISRPADIARLVLQGPANGRPKANSEIDLPSLQAWANRCIAKDYRINMLRLQRSSVRQALRDVCAAGRAILTQIDGKWGFAFEDDGAPIVQHFTAFNSWGFEMELGFPEIPHAFRVPFTNEDKGYIQDERFVFDDGYNKANATLIEKAEFPGITDTRLVEKHGRYRFAEAHLRPHFYRLFVDAEGLIANRPDRVIVSRPELMNEGQSGWVESLSGNTVTLSEPVLMEPGKSFALRFRSRDGSFPVRTVQTTPGASKIVTLTGSGPLPAGRDEDYSGDLFSFGPATTLKNVFRVHSIKPGTNLTAQLTLVDDAPEIEDADTKPIPAYDSGLVAPIDLRKLPPYRLSLVESVEVNAGAATFVSTLLFSEVPGVDADSFSAEAKSSRGKVVKVDTREQQARFLNLAPGVWTFRVQSVFGKRRTVWSDPLIVTVMGKNRPADDPPRLRLNIIGQQLLLAVDGQQGPVMAFEFRYSPKTTAVAWQAMTRLVAPTTQPNLTVKLRDGTYAAKAISYGGKPSRNAVFAVVVNSGAATVNVVSTISEPGTWAGTKQNTIVTNGMLRLDLAGDIFANDDFFAPADFFAPGGQLSYASSGTYTMPGTIDLGAVYTSSLTPMIDARGDTLAVDFFAPADFFAQEDVFGFDAADWDATIQISTTQADPALGMWSEWTDLDAGDVTARAMRFRLLLESFDTSVTPLVASASVLVDMPDRIIAAKDIVVPAAGLIVTWTAPDRPPLKELRSLVTVGQDMASGDRCAITAKSRTGFTVRFFNSAGTGVARTMDYQAIGYGVSK